MTRTTKIKVCRQFLNRKTIEEIAKDMWMEESYYLSYTGWVVDMFVKKVYQSIRWGLKHPKEVK